ncbi:MAG: hypothetical protein MH825_00940 [Cyanobacteria bacterium]|nr:hypothetical protein [Cyanobacteriota bacterium]
MSSRGFGPRDRGFAPTHRGFAPTHRGFAPTHRGKAPTHRPAAAAAVPVSPNQSHQSFRSPTLRHLSPLGSGAIAASHRDHLPVFAASVAAEARPPERLRPGTVTPSAMKF